MFMFGDPRPEAKGAVYLFRLDGGVTYVPGPADLKAFRAIGIPFAEGTTKEWAAQVVGDVKK